MFTTMSSLKDIANHLSLWLCCLFHRFRDCLIDRRHNTKRLCVRCPPPPPLIRGQLLPVSSLVAMQSSDNLEEDKRERDLDKKEEVIDGTMFG